MTLIAAEGARQSVAGYASSQALDQAEPASYQEQLRASQRAHPSLRAGRESPLETRLAHSKTPVLMIFRPRKRSRIAR